jgi:hypothetical protein
VLIYDATTQRWRVVEHEQGAWITPAFSAGNFTASGSMTWTVESGDVTAFRYWLKGKTLTVVYVLTGTTTGGIASISLLITIPNGFLSATPTYASNWVNPDNTTNTNNTISFTNVAGGGSPAISIQRTANFANWALATNRVDVRGEIVMEVI